MRDSSPNGASPSRLYGVPAFLMYCGDHLFYLEGVGGRRVTVFLTWVGTLFGDRKSRVTEGKLASVERRPAPAAEAVH